MRGYAAVLILLMLVPIASAFRVDYDILLLTPDRPTTDNLIAGVVTIDAVDYSSDPAGRVYYPEGNVYIKVVDPRGRSIFFPAYPCSTDANGVYSFVFTAPISGDYNVIAFFSGRIANREYNLEFYRTVHVGQGSGAKLAAPEGSATYQSFGDIGDPIVSLKFNVLGNEPVVYRVRVSPILSMDGRRVYPPTDLNVRTWNYADIYYLGGTEGTCSVVGSATPGERVFVGLILNRPLPPGTYNVQLYFSVSDGNRESYVSVPIDFNVDPRIRVAYNPPDLNIPVRIACEDNRTVGSVYVSEYVLSASMDELNDFFGRSLDENDVNAILEGMSQLPGLKGISKGDLIDSNVFCAVAVLQDSSYELTPECNVYVGVPGENAMMYDEVSGKWVPCAPFVLNTSEENGAARCIAVRRVPSSESQRNILDIFAKVIRWLGGIFRSLLPF